MSAILKNRFCPSFEALETRETPSALFGNPLSSLMSSVQQAAASVQAKAVSVVSPATLESRVLFYARTHLGREVGNGQCATLADAALQAAGAKTYYQLGPTGLNADYVWGKLVYRHSISFSGGIGNEDYFLSPSGIHAGDIIQYRNVKIVTPTSWMTATHHTAIVSQVLGNGKFKVLEQNWDNDKKDGKIVRESTIDLSHMTQGTVWIYQPVPR